MIKHRLGALIGLIGLVGLLVLISVTHGNEAAEGRDGGQHASTYLRCYYRASDGPFRFDTRYVWATGPSANGRYRLPGQWHGGQTYHWQALFYTGESQHALHSLCEESLRGRGIAANVVMYAAGNRSLAFDYAPWSVSAHGRGTNIDRVVALGDSLSDTHNLYNASRRQIPNGTSWFAGRFTNGRNWAEYLASDLHVPLYDWAVGGVGVSDRRVLPWADIPGVLSQARQWRQATKEDASYDPRRTLFTVLIGGNDLVFFNTPVQEILAKERETLQVLIDGGARNILVLNLPDVSRAPLFKLRGGASDVAAKVQRVNAGLESMMASMRQQYGPKLNIQLFDTHAFFTRLFDDPAAYGFQNSTESCLDINRTGFSNFMESHPPRSDCRNPDTFVFWDTLHPTTHTHRILADQVAEFVRLHFPMSR
jgi:thermolabile hemolysin